MVQSHIMDGCLDTMNSKKVGIIKVVSSEQRDWWHEVVEVRRLDGVSG